LTWLLLRLISLLTSFSSEETCKSGFWVRGLVWIAREKQKIRAVRMLRNE
jgi:hypothetical protein